VRKRFLATIAIYSMKGGVGKTTIAVNLAWASATLSGRRTLLWDLDGQAAASFILAPRRKAHDEARAVLERDIEAEALIQPTGIPRLDILPADTSLRALDTVFAGIDRKNRLRRLVEQLDQRYDRIILDCPPGLGDASEQVIRGASLILVPMIPSTLSRRAYAELRDHLDRHHKGTAAVFPVFSMVDRRRKAHRAALDADRGCPAIPMASAVEMMADRHAAIGQYAPTSPASKAFANLWTAIERRLEAG
jgi:cellulose biosynthesis protein BcsQ